MQFSQLDRSGLVSLLGKTREESGPHIHKQSGQPPYEPGRGLIWACWHDDSAEGEPPSLLIISDKSSDEFLAWAASFLGPFRPVTSFVRIIEWSEFQYLLQATPRSRNFPILAVLGAVLGEALMNATGRGFLENLPITAFESTYFSAIGQVFSATPNLGLLRAVDQGWNEARDLTDQPSRQGSVNAFLQVTTALNALNGAYFDVVETSNLDAVSNACLELRRNFYSPYILQRLLPGFDTLSTVDRILHASKERRVEAFESVAERLQERRVDDSLACFIIGYMASLVSDGSLEHSQLILPLQDRLHAAMLWYGVCAGLSPKSRIQSDYGHLGLRLQRLLFKSDSILMPPTCDISIAELKVLMRGNNRARGIRQTQSSALRVEIAPTVTTLVRWPSRITGADQQLSLFPSENRKAAGTTDDTTELVNTLRASIRISEKLLGQHSGNARSSSEPRAKKSSKR